jgi:hypothetical protein
MPGIYEPTRTQESHTPSAKGRRRQIIKRDYQRNNAGADTDVGLRQERNILSPDEVDEQIRRFFGERQP